MFQTTNQLWVNHGKSTISMAGHLQVRKLIVFQRVEYMRRYEDFTAEHCGGHWIVGYSEPQPT